MNTRGIKSTINHLLCSNAVLCRIATKRNIENKKKIYRSPMSIRCASIDRTMLRWPSTTVADAQLMFGVLVPLNFNIDRSISFWLKVLVCEHHVRSATSRNATHRSFIHFVCCGISFFATFWLTVVFFKRFIFFHSFWFLIAHRYSRRFLFPLLFDLDIKKTIKNRKLEYGICDFRLA